MLYKVVAFTQFIHLMFVFFDGTEGIKFLNDLKNLWIPSLLTMGGFLK